MWNNKIIIPQIQTSTSLNCSKHNRQHLFWLRACAFTWVVTAASVSFLYIAHRRDPRGQEVTKCWNKDIPDGQHKGCGCNKPSTLDLTV